MTPLKNTDKYLSDYLPAALVKDWRQCFRSRNYLILAALLLLVGWAMLAVVASDTSMGNLGSMLYLVFTVTLCLVIPLRAGMTVAADTRERSSNFLMLTPLSARSIVWGTWCSSACMVLMAALLLLPICLVGEVLRAASLHGGGINLMQIDWVAFGYDALTLGALALGGWVMAAFFMFCAGLPMVLRIALLLAMWGFSFEMVVSGNFIFCAPEKRLLPELAVLLPGLLNAFLLLLLFLELARHHYSTPAENCSRSVRLLALLPLLLFVVQAGVSYARGASLGCPEMQRSFALVYLGTAVIADALLPSCSLPPRQRRLWRWLPGWFQSPGFVPSVLCCTGAVLLSLVPALQLGAEAAGLLPCELVDLGSRSKMQAALVSGARTLNVGVTLLFWLLLTDCICRRNSAKRPLVYVAVGLAIGNLTHLLGILLSNTLLKSCLPTLSVTIDAWHASQELLWCICGGNAAALLLVVLLLLFWRGRVNKG